MFLTNRGRQKKIEELLTKGESLAQAGTFGEARKCAQEAFALACEALGENVALAARTHALLVHASVRLDDWAFAQSTLEHALQLFETRVGYDSQFTVPLRRSLLDIYARRENHTAVLQLVQHALTLFSDQHPEHAILRALSAPSFAALGRADDAVGTAKRAFDHASKRFEKQSEACAVTARQLAKVLIETGQDPATGFELVNLYRLRELPRTGPELVSFLRDSHLQALAHFQVGNLNEAAHFLELTMKMTFKPVWEVGGLARLLRGKLEALHGEVLAALGQPSEAASRVNGAIRDVETSAGPRHPELIPMLESYARVLRTLENVQSAEVQEKRVAALRSLLTGKRVAPVKQEARKAVTTAWPRRTFAGVFHLKHVTPAILTSIITSMRPVSPTDTGFETIPSPADQTAFIVINDWEKAWQPPVAVIAKNYFAALSNIIRLVNTGLAAAGATQVEIEPWAAVRDELRCDFEQWPPEHWEKLTRQVFPTLPDWRGDEAGARWLGDGIRKENDRPRYVSPSVTVAFVPNKGLEFVAIGPGALLDQWFVAFARATTLFLPESYAPLSEDSAKPQAVMGNMPVARA